MTTGTVPVDTNNDGKPELQAIPVCIVDTIIQETSPSELASLNSFPAPATNFVGTEPAVQILPQDKRRHRAFILVNGAANQGIVLGKQNQISNNKGFYLTAGQGMVYESAAALFAIPQATNGAVCLSVLDERYMPAGEYDERER